MSLTSQLSRALLTAIVALGGFLAMSHTTMGQGNASASTFGLGSSFGSFGGSTGATTGGQSSATTGLGAAAGTGGATGTGGLAPTLGGGGGLGSSFDPNFGASQMASGLATAAAVSRVTSSFGGGSGFGGGRGGFGGSGGRGGFGGNNSNQNAQSETKVRAVLRIGFPVEGRTSSATAQMVNQRFANMPLPPSVANVKITMVGRTAVLRGQIDAVEDGKLVENLLSLEQGIDGVKNELVIAGASEEVPAPVPAE